MSLLERELVPNARSFISTSATDSPRRAASRAMPAPLIPPPTIRRSTGAPCDRERSAEEPSAEEPSAEEPSPEEPSFVHIASRVVGIARRSGSPLELRPQAAAQDRGALVAARHDARGGPRREQLALDPEPGHDLAVREQEPLDRRP